MVVYRSRSMVGPARSLARGPLGQAPRSHATPDSDQSAKVPLACPAAWVSLLRIPMAGRLPPTILGVPKAFRPRVKTLALGLLVLVCLAGTAIAQRGYYMGIRRPGPETFNGNFTFC